MDDGLDLDLYCSSIDLAFGFKANIWGENTASLYVEKNGISAPTKALLMGVLFTAISVRIIPCAITLAPSKFGTLPVRGP